MIPPPLLEPVGVGATRRVAPTTLRVLHRSFYERNTEVVAFELIGKILALEENGSLLSGRIVETEAYLGAQDPASHAYRGPTPRNRVMFGPPGVSYVYFTYGNHHCLNVVTEVEDVAGAVLIRSLEPLSGIEVMKRRRGGGLTGSTTSTTLTNGPGKLTQAFGITRKHSGIDLTQGPFRMAEAWEDQPIYIGVAKRIGISRARDSLLRFYEMGNPFVSRA